MADSESITEAAASVTAYVVLKFTGEGGDQKPPVYELVARDVAARNADVAIRKHVARLADEAQDGLYVAIPARSWKPVNVSTKVERTLVVEDAEA